MSVKKPGAEEELFLTGMQVDDKYLDVVGIELKEGRNFSAEFPADSVWMASVILNETAVKRLNLDEPVVGQSILISPNNQRCTIIGVVKDFHFSSFHKGIDSFGFFWWARANKIAVKLAGGNIQKTLARIQEAWMNGVPEIPFDYYFLDTVIDRQYRFEQNFRTVFSAMTGLSLVIACLGLFGLAAFIAERRTKEIGIRKVLGASIREIVILLSTNFIKLVVGANLIAWPIAYFVMSRWLQNFAYHIEISWWIFALAGGTALVIAQLTVSTQAIRAALANPVEALRYE